MRRSSLWAELYALSKQFKFVPEFIGGVSGKCFCFFSGPVDFHTGPGKKQKT